MKNYYTLILFFITSIIIANAQNCNYGPIIGPTSVKPFSNATYAVTPINGRTFHWLDTCGVITSGQGTNIINIYWGNVTADGFVYVYADSCLNQFFLSVNITTGIIEPTWAKDIKYFPNPVQDFFNITLPKDASINKLIIYDLLDRPVKTIVSSTNENQIDIKDLSSGLYFLTLYGDGEKTIKIMKQ